MAARIRNAGICGLLEVGPEKWTADNLIEGIDYDDPACAFTAHPGTMFDPSNPQHTGDGSDGLRLAIGIQMARDRGDYIRSDAVREAAIHWGFQVSMSKSGTTLVFVQTRGLIKESYARTTAI